MPLTYVKKSFHLHPAMTYSFFIKTNIQINANWDATKYYPQRLAHVPVVLV